MPGLSPVTIQPRLAHQLHLPQKQVTMYPDKQKTINDGLRSIMEKVLKKSPWDPSLGLTPDTARFELDYAVKLLDDIVQSAVSLRNEQARIRNRMVPRINELPAELLSTIWRHALSGSTAYHFFLNKIRHTSSYWDDIIRNDPSFWSVIQCDDPLNLVKTCLERSKSLPLRVFVPCTDATAPDDDSAESHDHYTFVELLEKYTPPRGISELHLKPCEENWESLAEFISVPTPVLLVLTVEYGSGVYNRTGMSLRGLYLCAGVAPSLQVLELTRCDLPTEYPPLPSLLSCTLDESRLSRDDLIRLIASAPALQDLSVTRCSALKHTGRLPIASTSIHTRIRLLYMKENMFDRRDGNGEDTSLISVLNYLQVPDLERFELTENEGAQPHISEWVSSFTERHRTSTLMIWQRLGSLYTGPAIFVDIRPDFQLSIPLADESADTVVSIISGLVNAIHPTAYPSITILELKLSQPVFDIVLPPLASKFTATSELVASDDAPKLWTFLGQKQGGGEWPLPDLKTIRIEDPWRANGTVFTDLLRTRQGLQNASTPVEQFVPRLWMPFLGPD